MKMTNDPLLEVIPWKAGHFILHIRHAEHSDLVVSGKEWLRLQPLVWRERFRRARRMWERARTRVGVVHLLSKEMAMLPDFAAVTLRDTVEAGHQRS